MKVYTINYHTIDKKSHTCDIKASCKTEAANKFWNSYPLAVIQIEIKEKRNNFSANEIEGTSCLDFSETGG